MKNEEKTTHTQKKGKKERSSIKHNNIIHKRKIHTSTYKKAEHWKRKHGNIEFDRLEF